MVRRLRDLGRDRPAGPRPRRHRPGLSVALTVFPRSAPRARDRAVGAGSCFPILPSPTSPPTPTARRPSVCSVSRSLFLFRWSVRSVLRIPQISGICPCRAHSTQLRTLWVHPHRCKWSDSIFRSRVSLQGIFVPLLLYRLIHPRSLRDQLRLLCTVGDPQVWSAGQRCGGRCLAPPRRSGPTAAHTLSAQGGACTRPDTDNGNCRPGGQRQGGCAECVQTVGSSCV